MAEEKVIPMGYGFEDDNVQQSTMHFGGNFGHTYITKFELNTKAGKKDEQGNPTDGEALDVVFDINGTEKNYRLYPVLKAFDENNTEITDPKHPAFQKAMKNFSQICVQIMKCFVDENDVKAALAKRIESFKDYVGILIGLLPKNFSEKKLDIFLQWGWQITGENDKTYLEIPKKVQYGKFLCAAVEPVNGPWKLVTTEDGTEYRDGANNKHPYFSRSVWFNESNFAKQQKEGGDTANALNNSTPAVGGASAGTTSSGW